MDRFRRLLFTASFLLLIAQSHAAQPLTPDQKKIFNAVQQKVICQCSCRSILANCLMQGCMVRNNMRAQIQAQIRDGKSEEQILASLVSVYGRKVLASPPKHGFFLSAWVLPFFGLLLGIGFLFFFLRRWAKAPHPKEAPSSPTMDPQLKPYLDMFDE